MSNRQSIVFFGLVAALIVTTFTAGYLVRNEQVFPQARYPLFQEALQIVRDNGLKELPVSPELEYGMIRGMLQEYADPYTILVEPIQSELDSNALQGIFGGIGVHIDYDREGHTLLFPLPDSPAEASGILEGDRLIKVDQVEIPLKVPIETILSALRGPINENVTLTIARAPEYTLQEVRVKRAEFTLPSVAWHPAPGFPQFGIVKVNLIADNTAEEIQKAIQELTERGVLYFILDLRDNPGGLLNAAVEISRLFLKQGGIVTEIFRGKEPRTYTVDNPGPLSDISLVVLVNENSASAAEIIAGALQAHQRAELVGRPTFGKDSIQLVFNLSNRSSLHVTAAKWLIPGLAYDLNEGGLKPDILIPSSQDIPGLDQTLQSAIESVLSHR